MTRILSIISMKRAICGACVLAASKRGALKAVITQNIDLLHQKQAAKGDRDTWHRRFIDAALRLDYVIRQAVKSYVQEVFRAALNAAIYSSRNHLLWRKPAHASAARSTCRGDGSRSYARTWIKLAGLSSCLFASVYPRARWPNRYREQLPTHLDSSHSLLR